MFGAMSALELVRRGHAVTLVDRTREPHPDASSTDISKMIRMDYGSDVFYHELAEESLAGWERWNASWPRPLYHDEGFLVLSRDVMSEGGFEYESHRVLRERGYEPERLDSSTLARRYPAWNADLYRDGYVSRPGGWAESGAVVAHLLAACASEGVRFLVAAFGGLEESGSRVSGVRLTPDRGGPAAGESVLPADTVVIATGAWTPALLPWLDGALTTVAQPVLHFGSPDASMYRGPHFPPFAADIAGSGWYGFPALPDGRIKLGHHSTGRQVAPDDRGEVSGEHVALARSFLADSIPALADAPIVGNRVCLYCDTFDGDLFIDRDPHREGLVVAAGGNGHAFKFAPVLGAIVADVVEKQDNPWQARFRWRSDGERRIEAARHMSTD